MELIQDLPTLQRRYKTHRTDSDRELSLNAINANYNLKYLVRKTIEFMDNYVLVLETRPLRYRVRDVLRWKILDDHAMHRLLGHCDRRLNVNFNGGALRKRGDDGALDH